jgi:hypothetical protein
MFSYALINIIQKNPVEKVNCFQPQKSLATLNDSYQKIPPDYIVNVSAYPFKEETFSHQNNIIFKLKN